MSIGEILFVSTWFVSGFITMFSMWIIDMRNKEFDENYFSAEWMFFSLLVLILGYASLIGLIITYCYTHKPFTKLIYKIANIGTKSSKRNNN